MLNATQQPRKAETLALTAAGCWPAQDDFLSSTSCSCSSNWRRRRPFSAASLTQQHRLLGCLAPLAKSTAATKMRDSISKRTQSHDFLLFGLAPTKLPILARARARANCHKSELWRRRLSVSARTMGQLICRRLPSHSSLRGLSLLKVGWRGGGDRANKTRRRTIN